MLSMRRGHHKLPVQVVCSLICNNLESEIDNAVNLGYSSALAVPLVICMNEVRPSVGVHEDFYHGLDVRCDPSLLGVHSKCGQ